MKAYTTIPYKKLSSEQIKSIGVKIHYIEGRDNGLLYNGKIVISVPTNFNINDYLGDNPDIISCKDCLDKFIEIINLTDNEISN